ncbi:MAG: glycosyltransferase family 4 protein [Longimicrobiales bacterium]
MVDTRPRLLIVGGCDVHFRLELMSALRDRFHIAAAGSDPALARRFEESGFEFLHYALYRGVSPVRDVGSFFRLLAIIRSWRPAIVHAFDTKPTIWARLAARLAGVPVIVGTIPGRGSLYSLKGARAVLLKRILLWLEKVSSAASDVTVLQNRDDHDELVGAGVLRGSKTVVVPGSGIRTELLTPTSVPERERLAVRAELGARADDVVVTMVARVIRSKGVLEFADAADAVTRRFPNARCVLVGPDDRASLERLSPEELARTRRSLQWLGERTDVPALLAASDIFVLPSYYREGIPRVLLEAASMELPLITTRSPGCTEVVLDDVTGVLVPVRDADALARAISQLVADPALRRRYGSGARGLVVRRFDLSIIAGELAALYFGLLERPRRGRNGARRPSGTQTTDDDRTATSITR